VEIHFHILDYDGHKASCLAIAQDVTERNRLEIDLRQAQKLEAVGRLAAGIAHEINTPIQFVGDNMQFLHDAFADLSKVMEKYQHLSDAAANGVAGMMLADEVAEAEMAVDINYLVEEIPKAIAQSLDGVARVATLVRAMKEFAHPDRKERAAADINAALLSTLTVARNELKYVADVETEFGASAAGGLQHRRIKPGLPQLAGERRPCDWRRSERDRTEGCHPGPDCGRGKRHRNLRCRHGGWHPRRHSRQDLRSLLHDQRERARDGAGFSHCTLGGGRQARRDTYLRERSW
jgi:hypothetical protein